MPIKYVTETVVIDGQPRKIERKVPVCRCGSEDVEERFSLGITAGYWCDPCWAAYATEWKARVASIRSMPARPTTRTCGGNVVTNRRHSVANVESPDELAEKLTAHTWTLCTGFRLRHPNRTLLFLNDATHEDGAGEYAALLEDGQQIESITFSWCTFDEALQRIQDLVAGGGLHELGRFDLVLDEASNHKSCRHCM